MTKHLLVLTVLPVPDNQPPADVATDFDNEVKRRGGRCVSIHDYRQRDSGPPHDCVDDILTVALASLLEEAPELLAATIVLTWASQDPSLRLSRTFVRDTAATQKAAILFQTVAQLAAAVHSQAGAATSALVASVAAFTEASAPRSAQDVAQPTSAESPANG